MRKALFSAAIAALLLCGAQTTSAQDLTVTLMWDANPGPNIAGYRLHYGTSSQTYTESIDVGNTTMATVPDLPAGTYFFAATAYNNLGIESSPSEEVAYGTPLQTPTPPPVPTPSSTPTPSATSAPTSSPTPTLSPTATPVPTSSPTPSPTPVPTATSAPTSTPTSTPSPSAPPLITVSPTTVNFTGVAGGAFPAPKSIQVTTSSGGVWTSFDTSPWFDTFPTNTGPSGASCILTPHTEGMVAGSYSQNITFSATGLPNKIVVVTLTLTNSPTPTPIPTAAPTPTPTQTPPPPPTPTPTATPPTACVPSVFNLNGSSPRSGTPGNIRTYSISGVTVKVSAFSRKNSGGTWSTSWLNVASQGLGITGRSEGNGNGNKNLTDNIDDSTDYMLFEFSSPIVVTQVFLNSILAGHSNLSAWIGIKPDPIANHLTLSDTLLSSLGTRADYNTTSTASSRWAPINSAQNVGNVLVIAASVSDPMRNDGFRINKLQFCQGGIPGPIQMPPPANPSGLANVSTRLFVQAGDNAMIGGFIIAGDIPKAIILRAIGPSLAGYGVSGTLTHPALRLYDSTGEVIAFNDSWRSTQSETIEDTGLAPTNDMDAALVTTLSPGAYTAVVDDESNSPGVALFELYDLDPVSSQLLNLSTRGKVETEDRVMIGGFVINGDQPSQVILRAIGPSLTQVGIPNALVDPILELRDGDGALIVQNDNWRSDQEQQILNSALAPSDDREAAIVATLSPGPYTAIVRGTGNSTGVALFEIYRLTP